MMIKIVAGSLRIVLKNLEETESIGDQRKKRDNPDNSLVRLSKNTSEIPGELQIFAFI